MRRVSLKRAKLNREAKPERDAYREEFPTCQIPLCVFPATDLHEIARGPAREAALSERCAWLHLCRSHHLEMDIPWMWPLARQLAAKMLADPGAFDPETVNKLRGRSPGAVDLADIVAWLVLA